jgi:hypothetical protein
MEGKELVTENCVRALVAGSELVLGPERIATPAALDLAFQKRIRVVWKQEGGKASTPGGSDLWTRMKAREGTYVVVVRDGKALVTRLGAGVVETLGEE